MIELSWRGPAPQPAWVSELAAAGVMIGKAESGHVAAMTIVRTTGKELPKPQGRGAWLWLPATSPSTEAEVRAVLAGAVDVVAADDARLIGQSSREPPKPVCPSKRCPRA